MTIVVILLHDKVRCFLVKFRRDTKAGEREKESRTENEKQHYTGQSK